MVDVVLDRDSLVVILAVDPIPTPQALRHEPYSRGGHGSERGGYVGLFGACGLYYYGVAFLWGVRHRVKNFHPFLGSVIILEVSAPRAVLSPGLLSGGYQTLSPT